MRPTNYAIEVPIDLTPTGGVAGVITGSLTQSFVSEATMFPLQIIGAVPLIPCSPTECRSYDGDCYFNPVFGQENVRVSSYENDLNPFYIQDANFRKTFWWIQKLNTLMNYWEDIALVGASTGLSGFPVNPNYGTYYNYGHWPLFPSYQGFMVNWGSVLQMNGQGRYRVRVETPSVIDAQPQPFAYCFVSEPFEAKWWNCELADRTVKFESYMSGRIGSITNDGLVFNLCNITLYDSLRHKGFFGKPKTGYDEIVMENQSGLIDPVRDEALQKYTYKSRSMPAYVHDRFKTYFMMADDLYVSDYNWNNAYRNIRKKGIRKAAGYEPEYPLHSTLATVTTEFKDRIQQVIKSSSCPKR